MKIQYKIGILAVGLLAITSCEKHDIIVDKMEIGQSVPTCYWEVGSTTCKAGESFSIKGQYYTEEGHIPDHSEVWYLVKREDNASATVALAGSGLSYTKSTSSTDTVRGSEPIVSFPHSMSEWDGYEYVINGEVPTSSTLSPVSWNNVKTWDQDRYDTYFPEGFDTEFINEVIDYLISDSYTSALRTVYINYPFTNDQFAQVNSRYGVSLPTDIENDPDDPQAAVTDKSDRWYYTSTASDDAIIGYYYTTIDAEGNTVYHEISKDDYDRYKDTYSLWAVYDAASWLFCRYDDDQGAVVTTVRDEYIPAFRDLLSEIAFTDWIYSSTDGYGVEFRRIYYLDSTFKVLDTEGNTGVAYTIYTITIN